MNTKKTAQSNGVLTPPPSEDASLRYTGLESHKGLTHYGLYDTVVARE
jgi:hypothetical protein